MTDTGRVLVVEDEPSLRSLFVEWLEPLYDVTAVATGEAAIEAADRAPDVVLLDRRLPGMDGAAVLDRLADRGFDGMVALVTAVEPGRSVLELSFDDYLRKPVGEVELLRTVESLSARRDYDEGLRTYFELTTKVGVLEADAGPDGLADDPEYAALVADRDRVRARLDRRREQLQATGDYAKLFADVAAD